MGRGKVMGLGLMVLVMGGCGGDDTTPAPVGGNTVGGNTMGGSTVVTPGMTGSTDPGTTPTGMNSTPTGMNSAPIPTSGMCHALDASAAPRVMDQMSSTLPALNGGALQDGTYHLVKYEWYDKSASLHQRKIVLVISDNGQRASYLWQRNQEPEERVIAFVNVQGGRISFRGACPSGKDLEWDRYGVTADGFVLFSTRDTKAATFARR